MQFTLLDAVNNHQRLFICDSVYSNVSVMASLQHPHTCLFTRILLVFRYNSILHNGKK